MSIDGDRLRIVNPGSSITAADIRHTPSSGSSTVHALYVQQTAPTTPSPDEQAVASSSRLRTTSNS